MHSVNMIPAKALGGGLRGEEIMGNIFNMPALATAKMVMAIDIQIYTRFVLLQQHFLEQIRFFECTDGVIDRRSGNVGMASFYKLINLIDGGVLRCL